MLYYFLIIFTQLTDWYTTHVGVTSGKAKEANPVIANFIESYGSGTNLFLLKLFFGICFAVMFRQTKPLGWLVILIGAGITIHNLTVLY